MSGVVQGLIASLVSAAGAVTDTFFRYVSLLLNTSATNGAQNNTFLDGSSNAFAITRNGNTTQGTFSPFSQTGWSNYFDGTGDYLSAANNAAFQFGTGDFTIECWINTRDADFNLCGLATAGSGNWMMVVVASQFYWQTSYGVTNLFNVSATSILDGAWHHVAITRTGTSTRLFFDGVLQGTSPYTDSTNYAGTGALQIGSGVNGELNGYVSNLRIVKGTAVYTAAFTPPTSPLTAITNTSLLTCQSNRFIDNSSNAFAITRNGDVSVQAFSPFNPTAAWSASTNGGSGYFDGTGDYLSIADSATIRFGTGAFTIQGWVYRNAAGATHTIAAKGGASTGWVLQITSTNVLRFTDTTTNIDTTTTIPASTWTHVAVVRTGTGASGLKLYINAVDSATGTSSTDFNQTDALNIGADRSNANAFNGYIASLKYTVGTAESISVPTAPATGGTVLLNFTNAGIYDSASGNDLETSGNAQASTTQAKFGTTSIKFAGGSDWMQTVTKPALRFGTAPFTIEAWLYPTSAATMCVVSIYTGTAGWTWKISGNVIAWYDNTSGNIGGTAAIASNTWTHVAIVREGTGANQFKFYVNGVLDVTSTCSANFTQTANCFVGGEGGATPNFATSIWNGYIDDLRITNGYARYTANFTPPTAAFPLN